MHVYILLPGKAVLPLFFIFFASFFRIDNLRLLFLSFADNIERISNHLLKEKKQLTVLHNYRSVYCSIDLHS